MPQQTKIFRVFVSSTFNDMKVERRLLREKVFPFLEQFCRERGARLQAIDLRWGVSEESQRNQKTMEICLNEIRRCQRLSPRPNFLILLGDRYGWQPVPPAIPQTEMDTIRPHLQSDSLKLVEDWYWLDENAVPAEYVLQPRDERIKEYQEWEPIETQLRMVLRDAAKKANLAQQAQLKYTTSATHQEILAGALDPPPDVARPESHVLALSRTIPNLPAGEQAMDYLDFVQGTPDPYSQTQLGQLRKDLQTKLKKEHYIEYSANWVKDAIVLEDEQYFIDKIIQHLQSVIESELQQRADEDEIEREARYHEEFAKSLTTYFTGRKESLDRIRDYLDNKNNRQVLALVGASGSGKTCLMARAILDAKERNAVLVYRFIGANAGSSNIVHLLGSVCREIAQAFGTDLQSLLDDAQKGLYLDINLLIPLFRKCLQLANPATPLILFLDALDQLSDSDNAGELRWLPRELAPHVHLIVSSLPRLEGALHDTEVYHLPMMPGKEGEHLLETWLSAQGRTLTDIQKKQLLAKFKTNGLPLFLKLAFEQARKWCSYSKPANLPDDVPALIEQFVSALETEHSPALVSTAVGYLLSGKNRGLTEDEILDMLAWDEDYWRYFLQHSHPTHRDEIKEAKKLPVVIWSRLFLDLAPYLTERDSYDERIIGFYHRQFEEILRLKYLQDEKHRHRRLAKYFAVGPHFFDGDEQNQPNVRKCVELPWQQTQGEMWDEVRDTLCDLDFIQTKTRAKMTYDLMRDYNLLFEVLPEAKEQAEIENLKAKMLDEYVHKLILFSSTCTIPFPEFRSPNSINNISDLKRNTNYNRLISTYNFIKKEASLIQKYCNIQGYCTQQVLNFSNSEMLCKQANKRIAQSENVPIILLKNGTDNSESDNPILLSLDGHHNFASKIRLSYNSRICISCDAEGYINVWNLDTGECQLKINIGVYDRESWNIPFDITPDGKMAFSASVNISDRRINLWDLQDGKCIFNFPTEYKIKDVVIKPDRSMGFAAHEDGILIFDLQKMILTKEIEINGLECISWIIKSSQLLAGLGNGDLVSINWENKNVNYNTIFNPNDGINWIKSLPDGTLTFSSMSGPVWVGNINNSTFKKYDLDSGPTGAFDTVIGGQLIVGLCNENTLKVIDVGKSESRELNFNTEYIDCLACSIDGKIVVIGYNDCLKVVKLDFKCRNPKIYYHEKHPIYSELSMNKGIGVTVGSQFDDKIKIWDLNSCQILQEHEINGPYISYAILVSNGKEILVGNESGDVYHFDIGSGNKIQGLDTHGAMLINLLNGKEHKKLGTGRVETIKITPDLHLCLVGHKNGIINIWDFVNNKFLKSLNIHLFDKVVAMPPLLHHYSFPASSKGSLTSSEDIGGEINSMELSNDGRIAISAHRNGKIILWDIEYQIIINAIDVGLNYIRSMAISSNNQYLAFAVDGCFIKVVDLISDEEIICIKNNGKVSFLCFLPDNKQLLFANESQIIRFDIYTKIRNKILKNDSLITCISITQDWNFLIVASDDRTIKLVELYNYKTLAVFVSGSAILTISTINNDGSFICGARDGTIYILQISGINLKSPIISPQRLFYYNDLKSLGEYSSTYIAKCKYCGEYFDLGNYQFEEDFKQDVIKFKQISCRNCGKMQKYFQGRMYSYQDVIRKRLVDKNMIGVNFWDMESYRLLKDNKIEQIILLYQKMLNYYAEFFGQADPILINICENLGLMYLNRNNPQKAINYFLVGISNFKDKTDVRIIPLLKNLARCYHESGDKSKRDETLKIFKKLIDLHGINLDSV